MGLALEDPKLWKGKRWRPTRQAWATSGGTKKEEKAEWYGRGKGAAKGKT